MKAKLILVMLFSISVAACGGGGGGGGNSGGATPISATATTTAQSLTVGTAMTSFSPLTPSGGATPYTYSYTGTLPAGLSFNTSNGAVSGTPTAIYTTANLVFSAQDANNVVASTTSTVIFTVGAAGPLSATATTTAQSLTVGTAMTSFSPLTPSGGATPYTYSYTGTLPAGLSFNTSNGAVTGTPTTAYATASLVFSVKDANNVMASTASTVSFTVIAVPASSYNLSGVTANGVTLGGNLIAPVTITAAQSIDGKAHTYYYWDVSGNGTSAGVDTVTHDLLDQIFNGGTLGDSFYDTTDAPSSNTVTLSNGVTIHLPTKAELSALFTAKPPNIMLAECGPPSWGTTSMRNFWSATLDQVVTSGIGAGSFHFYSVSCTTIFDSSYNQLGIDDSFPRSAAFEVVPTSSVIQGGLTWMPVTFYDNWTNANAYCANTNINGQAGWRLPTQPELSALYVSGAMNGQGWTLSGAWSSTVYSAGNHYIVFLDIGLVVWSSDMTLTYVSCVR